MAKDKITKQLEDLNKMSVNDLRNYFHMLFGLNAKYTYFSRIQKRIAHKLQELHYGGLSESDKKFLNDIADKDPLANLTNSRKRKVPEGTCFFRNWRDKEYSVTADGNGKFIYDGKIYKSLTAVASEITGTHWNGKKFFGVK